MKKPITVDAIVDAAFDIIAAEGYEALTMRRVAAALETGPASLYAHVVNKDDLDDLLIGHLCAEIELPEGDPTAWRQQLVGVCAQLRDQYLRYPGISRAAMAVAPTNVDTLRVSEGMLGILLAGGVNPQIAVWTADALILYVNAFCLESSPSDRHEADFSGGRDHLQARFEGLPDTFPNMKRHARELTSGTPSDRFEFTVTTFIAGIDSR